MTPFEVLHSGALGRGLLDALGLTVRIEEGGTSDRKTAAMINRDALGWLDGRPEGRPFFLFLNYFDAHAPYVVPDGPGPRFGLSALPRGQQVELLLRYQRLLQGKPAPGDGPPDRVTREAIEAFRDAYESCIAALDREVGRLLDGLGRRGLLENTLVIVTSDHGEHLMERGFRGHGVSLYDREVRVPLLILPPARSSESPPRAEVAEAVSLRDVPATVADLLGFRPASPFPGRSLRRCWDPTAAPDRGAVPILSEVEHQTCYPPTPGIPATLGPVQALFSGGMVYIRNGDRGEEVYDQRSDPFETRNLAGDAAHRPTVERLRGLLDRALAGGRTPTRAPGLDTLAIKEDQP